MGNVALPPKNEVKYLGMHRDRRLTWAKHIKPKRKPLSLKAKQMHWILGRSTLSTESNSSYTSSVQTHLNLWNSAMGDSLQFQHQNPQELSIQDSPIHSECTWIHKKPQYS
jgi:hypothetical protein